MKIELASSDDLELVFANEPSSRLTKKKFVNAKPLRRKDGLWLGRKCLMYDYERPWIKKGAKLLIEKVKPSSLLEIGFGLGFTATQFQECSVKKHVILEPNKSIFKQALRWKRKYPGRDIRIYNLFSWEFRPKEKFDLVYDDRYDLVKRSVPSIKEFERFCRADTCVAVVPILGKVRLLGSQMYFKVKDKTYTQPSIPFNLLEKQLVNLDDLFYAGGVYNCASLRVLSQLASYNGPKR